jgi:hypothetical protein
MICTNASAKSSEANVELETSRSVGHAVETEYDISQCFSLLCSCFTPPAPDKPAARVAENVDSDMIFVRKRADSFNQPLLGMRIFVLSLNNLRDVAIFMIIDLRFIVGVLINFGVRAVTFHADFSVLLSSSQHSFSRQ